MASSAVFCLSLQIRVGSNNSSISTITSGQEQQQILQDSTRESNQRSTSETSSNLQNSTLINEILGNSSSVGDPGIRTANNIILLNARAANDRSNVLVQEGQAVTTSLVLENGAASSSGSRSSDNRKVAVGMERSGATAVNSAVRGVFIKSETLDGGGDSGGAAGAKNNDGEPIKLPENLESLPKADHFPTQRHRWNTNEEIAAILISFERHNEWQSKEVKIRPKSGSMLLYSRKKVRYRRDGYCWKKRKDGKTTREDHMKLKVQGTECIYGCYVHSAILPTFHRRCYWLLQNPDIVLVHYLNVPYPDDNKLAVITPSLALWGDKKEWTKEELVSQLKPMCESPSAPSTTSTSSTSYSSAAGVSQVFSEDEPDLNNELEISTAETVEAIVTQLMEKQRLARAAALTKQLECGCPDSTCADGKTCSHPMRRITAAKTGSATDITASSNTRQTVVSMAALNTENNNQDGEFSTRLVTEASKAAIGKFVLTMTSLDASRNTYEVSSTTGSGSMILTAASNNASNTTRLQSRDSISLHSHHSHQQQQQQQQQQHSHHTSSSSNSAHPATTSTPPLVLSLSQIQGGGGLLILNSSTGSGSTNPTHQSLVSPVAVTSFVCSTNSTHQQRSHHQHHQNHHHSKDSSKSTTPATIVLKQEAMETSSSPSSCCHQVSVSESSTTTTNISTLNINNNNNININSSNKMDVTNGNVSSGFDSGGATYLSSGREKNVLRSATPKQQHVTLSSNQTSSMNSAPPTPTKHMDTSGEDLMDIKPTYCGSDTVLVISSSSNSGIKNTDTVSLVGGFFNETLDLSQEDIQRTLSANMPLSCSTEMNHHRRGSNMVTGAHHIIASKSMAPSSGDEMSPDDVIVSEINPMDFIDSCDVVVSPTQVDDDVFVNLDAFDMLGDFPELEILEPSTESNTAAAAANTSGSTGMDHSTPEPPVSQGGKSVTSSSSVEKGNEQASPRMDYREGTANITDYSPEWAYPEGGVKVLVTGPWYSTTSPYTVLFDTFPVPTTLVQSGVLRCYCPAHEVGLATLQVACEGFVISNSVIFEYKKPAREDRASACEPKLERSSSDNLLKFTLLQRLEAMDDRLQIKQEPDGSDLVEGSTLFNQNNFEDRLVSYCQEMTSRAWRSGEEVNPSWFSSHRGMTLLHLAASLGYSRLVCAMLHWRAENSSLLLETEVDALSQDEDGYTPLMWACARGHRETAILLYRWNHTALNVRNLSAQTASDCARSNKHEELAQEMERLEAAREKNNMTLLGSSRNSSTNSTSLGSPSCTLVGAEVSSVSPAILDTDNMMLLTSSASPDVSTLSPAGSVVSLASVASTSRSHDGVFLRPGAVTSRSESQKYKVLSLELHVNIPQSGEAGSTVVSETGSNHSSSSSPIGSVQGIADSSNIASHLQNSSTTSISQPSQHHRLTKRPSVDSGIHLGSVQSSDSLPSLRPRGSKLVGGRETPKLSRFDRSMSLPLNSPMSGVESSYDSAVSEGRDGMRNSPVRRMDFALCEVATGPRSESPIIDVEAVSDEESEAKQSVVGEQEVRVLTLAEQIIAAMPERIKNESEDMMLGHDCSPSQPESSTNASDSLSEVFMEPLLMDEPSSTYEPVEFNFEFSDHNYRYYDVGTPSSSLSPASSSCLQSPCSFTLDSPSPPPTTADFCEFFQASSSLFEKDFSNLTLSDREQRELYEAAKIIQKAYRSYKGRKKLEEQDKERAAAVLIQNYYRRYKQYAYFKQMTRAAMVIQNGFRSYCEHKRFKKSQEAAVCIQNYYRNYREQGGRGGSREGTPSNATSVVQANANSSSGLKRTYSQRRQHQAARKIQQFMRQSKNKLQKERALAAEKERQEARSVDVLPRSLCPDNSSAYSSTDPSNSGNSNRHKDSLGMDTSDKT
ncbi:calmodulin-binding transcription activator 2 isoform X3 [Periplaneta americana]|uniref:calmodulin-binding transcription activator 2 isoform X3 n=1 Tax=Periplaneta americana TaxID=6978 RepID=UPI0037E7B847